MLELLRGGPISASSIPGPPIVNGEAPFGTVGRLNVLGGVLLVLLVVVVVVVEVVVFLGRGIAEVFVIFMVEVAGIVLLIIGVVLTMEVLLTVVLIGAMVTLIIGMVVLINGIIVVLTNGTVVLVKLFVTLTTDGIILLMFIGILGIVVKLGVVVRIGRGVVDVFVMLGVVS